MGGKQFRAANTGERLARRHIVSYGDEQRFDQARLAGCDDPNLVVWHDDARWMRKRGDGSSQNEWSYPNVEGAALLRSEFDQEGLSKSDARGCDTECGEQRRGRPIPAHGECE